MNQRGIPVLVATAVVALLFLACGDNAPTTPPSPPPPGGHTDTIAPQPVLDLALSYDAAQDAVVFSWTAPRDDAAHARVDHYEIRYGSVLPFDWKRAVLLGNPPTPLDPGAMQEFTFAHPARARHFHASIRAFDQAGNESPLGVVAHLRVPGYTFELQFVNVLTGAPAAGLDAVIAADTTLHIETGADGRVVLTDLPPDVVTVAASTGSAAIPFHTLNDWFDVAADGSRKIAMVPFQQPESSLYASILALLRDAIFSPGAERIIRRWYDYPVAFYARDFVNVNGLDYRALLGQAAERWNERLGFQMFAPVTADPATGTLVEFLPRSTMGSVSGVTDYLLDADGYPVHDRIRIVDDMQDGARLYSILLHELGHTIPLQHLPAGFIMYGAQPLPSDISDDEVAMVKLLIALPNGTNLDRYDAAPPPP